MDKKTIYDKRQKMKDVILSIIAWIDYVLALALSYILRSDCTSQKILLVPAADINGGFGEDVMVCGFISNMNKPITIYSTINIHRDYLANADNVNVFVRKHKRFFLSEAVLLMTGYSELDVIGADILDGIYECNRFRFQLLYLAHKMRLKTNITGFSVTNNMSSYFINEIRTYSHHSKVKARDVDSFHRLQNTLPVNELELVPDIAFLCDSPERCKDTPLNEWLNSQRESGRLIAAYCPNTIQAKKLGLEEYLNLQENILRCFIDTGCSVLLLYHDLRKYALGISDKDLSNLLFCRLKEKVFFVDSILDGYTMKSYIAKADFTIAGRMHFGISGYTLNKPMFGICYYNKFEGLQKMFHLPVNDTLVDYSCISVPENTIKTFVANIPLYKSTVSEFLPQIVESSKNNFAYE